MKKVIAYHWSRNDDCLGYGDGRQIIEGETLSVTGKPSLCNYGLHGSTSVIDALGYASGSHLWLVEISGNIDSGGDKLCGNHRKAIIEYGDLLFVIVEFATWCADRAREHAKSAKSAAKYAKSAEYAAKYAKSAAKSAAEYAAKYAKYAKSAAEYAEYAAKYAKSAAEYATSEKALQEQWWTERLDQIRTR